MAGWIPHMARNPAGCSIGAARGGMARLDISDRVRKSKILGGRLWRIFDPDRNESFRLLACPAANRGDFVRGRIQFR
jgi:hypothetical protein